MAQEKHLLSVYASALSDKVAKLSDVLNHTFGLDCFFYSRLSPKGRFFHIGNQPEVCEQYFSSQLYKSNPLISHPDNFIHDSPIITDDFKHAPFYEEQCRVAGDHGFNNFLCIPKKENGDTHLFMFSSSQSQLRTNTVFLQNQYALSRFGDYFLSNWKEQTGKIEDFSVNMGDLIGPDYFSPKQTLLYSHPKKRALQDYAKKLGLWNKYAALDTLSPRERECAKLMLRGMTAAQIGHILGLQKRTVYDYLNHAKEKLFCETKHQLFQMLQEASRMHLL